MKKTCIFLVSIGLFFLYSCNEEFLELKEPRKPTLESYYTDTATAFTGLVGCYNSMQGMNFGALFKLDIRSDDVDLAGDPLGEPGPIDNEWFAIFQIYSDNGLSSQLWTYCYRGVNTVNKYLEGVSVIEMANPNMQKVIDQYKAEATFMRAYFYFTLVKNYGAVPLLIKSLAPSEWFTQLRTPEPQVYAQIQKDLRDAIPNLKQKKGLKTAEAGRISKEAAMALLAKVLITEAGIDDSKTTNWQEAWDLTNEIIQNTGPLSTNFQDVFSKQAEFGQESVFEIVFDENIAGETDPFVHSLTPRIFFVNGKPTEMKLEYGFGSFGVTENLANQYGWSQTDDSLTRANLPDIRGIYTFWTRFDRFLDLIPVDNLTQRPETKKPELLYDNANYYARKYNRTSKASHWAVAGMNLMVIRYAEV
jgi:starch-binding outer membrane protein, SusD/RagB family